MPKEYRQMLLDAKTHGEIKVAKGIISSLSGRRASSSDVIDEFIGRRVRFLSLQKEIRDYINAFVDSASLDKHVLGILLFGSVARNSFNNYSDIDLLVIIDGNALERYDHINGIIEGVDRMRRPIIDSGMHLRIRPLLLSLKELHSFRPIYIDFLEEGIVLFERRDTLFGFINEIRRSVAYEKKIVNGNVVVKWKIRA